jgi:hypothetical protein
METSELTGTALDWAVARSENLRDADSMQAPLIFFEGNYSKEWDLAGPIIERERIDVWFEKFDADDAGLPIWGASIYDSRKMLYGHTPLIAAMRCYVASKLGDEVEVPDEMA